MSTSLVHSIERRRVADAFARTPRVAALACLVLGLTACATSPPPTREEIHEQTGTLTKMPLAEPWKAAAPPTEAIQDNWLATFDDPQLDALVAEALAGSPDLGSWIS